MRLALCAVPFRSVSIRYVPVRYHSTFSTRCDVLTLFGVLCCLLAANFWLLGRCWFEITKGKTRTRSPRQPKRHCGNGPNVGWARSASAAAVAVGQTLSDRSLSTFPLPAASRSLASWALSLFASLSLSDYLSIYLSVSRHLCNFTRALSPFPSLARSLSLTLSCPPSLFLSLCLPLCPSHTSGLLMSLSQCFSMLHLAVGSFLHVYVCVRSALLLVVCWL